MMASVMKIRRKSCGVKRSGPPVVGSVRGLWARAALSMLRIAPEQIRRCSVPSLRWNSQGAGASQTHSARS